jgi:hypothetical protein
MDSSGISASLKEIGCSTIGINLSWTFFLKEHLSMKSLDAYPLIAGFGWYKSLYSPYSISHLTSHINRFGLWRICHKGWSVIISIFFKYLNYIS